MPKRIQRRRVKGWRMPEGAVYVGRLTKWGNPFKRLLRADVLVAYRLYIEAKIRVNPRRWDLDELRGRDLACWCAEGEPCHADVLLRLANEVDGR